MSELSVTQLSTHSKDKYIEDLEIKKEKYWQRGNDFMLAYYREHEEVRKANKGIKRLVRKINYWKMQAAEIEQALAETTKLLIDERNHRENTEMECSKIAERLSHMRQKYTAMLKEENSEKEDG